MKAVQFSLLLLFFIIFSNIVLGATVHGNIYDLSLKKISEARVKVNTTPEQFFISKDGTYSFKIPNGFYEIRAELNRDSFLATETRNVSINQDGDYIIDLILFPNFEEEEGLLQDIEISVPEIEKGKFAPIFVILFVVVLGIIIFTIFISNDNKTSEENKGEKIGEKTDEKEYYEKDLDDIVEIIKKENGRTTQKEIRKQIPLSEAKISLMIAELEHKGVIQKIKKGRGNIIILRK